MTRRIAQTFILFFAVSIFATACHSVSKPPAITGTGIYMLNIPLPPDAVVRFQFVKTTQYGDVTAVIDEVELHNIRRAPIPFEIPYRPSDIKGRDYYGVTCEIRSGDRVLFRAARPFPVLTHGNPKNVEVLLEAVR